jgi:shikimate kinase
MKTVDYNILLIGFMGSGKSTISSELSNILNMKEIDMDQYIEEKEGRAIKEMFETDGEEYFRNRETQAVNDFKSLKSVIISCGGGAVLRQENVEAMKEKGKIVLLTASPETTFERVKSSSDRPILNGNMNIEFIKQLMEKRADKYKQAADITITTDNKTVQEICNELIASL